MNYISIKQLMDDILVDPMMRDLTLDRAVNYAVVFTKKIGMPVTYEEKIAIVPIKNYRGVLPCDFYQMIQVRMCNSPALLYSSSTFEPTGYSYKIQDNVIFTSIEETELEIAYRAIRVDDDGFPLIPDNGTFADALRLYITKEWYSMLCRNGKVNIQILNEIKQEYAWAVGQAQSDLVRPSLDQMQSFTNMWNTLLPSRNEHARNFRTTQDPEILK